MLAKYGILLIAAYVSTAQGVCLCGVNYDPVCGTDGLTYYNRCKLSCSGEGLLYPGECARNTPQPDCSCNKEVQPVCGSDRITYTNVCELNCATAQNSQLSLSKQGACNSTASEISCVCPDFISSPICGSDGKIYKNDCEIKCAIKKNPKLTIVNFRHCDPSRCYCGRAVKPVCGSDGETYENHCVLNCATAKNSQLSVAYEGACNNTAS